MQLPQSQELKNLKFTSRDDISKWTKYISILMKELKFSCTIRWTGEGGGVGEGGVCLILKYRQHQSYVIWYVRIGSFVLNMRERHLHSMSLYVRLTFIEVISDIRNGCSLGQIVPLDTVGIWIHAEAAMTTKIWCRLISQRWPDPVHCVLHRVAAEACSTSVLAAPGCYSCTIDWSTVTVLYGIVHMRELNHHVAA